MRRKPIPDGTDTQPTKAVTAALLSRREAAAYLALSIRRLEGDPTIPKINVASAGARKPSWRYERQALDAWIAEQRPLRPKGEGRAA